MERFQCHIHPEAEVTAAEAIVQVLPAAEGRHRPFIVHIIREPEDMYIIRTADRIITIVQKK